MTYKVVYKRDYIDLDQQFATFGDVIVTIGFF